MSSVVKNIQKSQNELRILSRKDATGFLKTMTDILKNAGIVDKNGKLTKKYRS